MQTQLSDLEESNDKRETVLWRGKQLSMSMTGIAFHTVGVVLVNRCCGFAFSVEVTSSFCGAVLKATAPIGEVTVFSTGGNVVDRMKTANRSPTRNITSLNMVLNRTC